MEIASHLPDGPRIPASGRRASNGFCRIPFCIKIMFFLVSCLKRVYIIGESCWQFQRRGSGCSHGCASGFRESHYAAAGSNRIELLVSAGGLVVALRDSK